jgi:hypothetical protein
MLKKWIKILKGNSDLHVNQDEGKIYSKDKVKGYYNDLTEKINWYQGYDKSGIPLVMNYKGESIYFPITISQYALGNYDLYLMTNEKIYYKQFINSVRWLIDNQDIQGGWNVLNPMGCKYSAMAQGEGVSVLTRAFIEFNDNKYLNAAVKASELMLKPIKNGGTARYIKDNLYFEEFAKLKPSLVLNGWIFTIFGLFDIAKLSDDKNYADMLNITLKTLEGELVNYDCGYWSYYDQCGHLASPFYHRLHIAQLNVLYDLFHIKNFKVTSERWESYLLNKFKKSKAIIFKIWQKIKEPG